MHRVRLPEWRLHDDSDPRVLRGRRSLRPARQLHPGPLPRKWDLQYHLQLQRRRELLCGRRLQLGRIVRPRLHRRWRALPAVRRRMQRLRRAGWGDTVRMRRHHDPTVHVDRPVPGTVRRGDLRGTSGQRHLCRAVRSAELAGSGAAPRRLPVRLTSRTAVMPSMACGIPASGSNTKQRASLSRAISVCDPRARCAIQRYSRRLTIVSDRAWAPA